MKKSLISCVMSVACLAAPAAFAQASSFEGLSASVGLGLVGANTRATVTDGADSVYGDFGKTSAIGVFDVGYGFAAGKDFVVGLGGTIDLGKTKAGGVGYSVGGSAGDVTIKLKNHYSLYVQPTWVVTPTTGIYAKVGYHHAKGTVSDSAGSSESSNIHGYGLGLGVKTFVNKSVFVQVEALATNYKNKTVGDVSYKGKAATALVSVGSRF